MSRSLNINNYLQADAVPIAGYPFAITGWFRIHQIGASTALVGIMNETLNTKYELVYAGNSDQRFVANAFVGSSAAARSAIPLVVGQWHYLTASFVSPTYRVVYVDGGNVGFNTGSRAFVPAELFYVGNKNNASQVDVAELAIVETTISSSQAGSLAQGVPLLATSLARYVVAYYDLVRETNRPGWGSQLSSVGTTNVVEHPRVRHAQAGQTLVMPVFTYGPWRVEQALLRSSHAASSQIFVSGVDESHSILAGGVLS